MNDDKSPAVDPWQDLRALNDLDLGVLAHRAGPSLMCMRQALPVTVNMRRSAGQETPGEWGEAFAIVARDGARLRASFPPPPDAELTALSAFLGQPRGRLMEGAQRLVERNDELRDTRRQACDRATRFEGIIVTMGSTLEELRAKHGESTTALLAIGGALEVVGTGKPWAEIGKAGVEAVALLNTHLKTARQGWADESAAACRARVEWDKSRAEVATLQEQVAALKGHLSAALSTAEGYRREAAELTTLRDAARTLLPADSTPNPATGWLADVIRRCGATIGDLHNKLGESRAETADLHERLTAAERLAADWKRTATERGNGAVRIGDLDMHRLPHSTVPARPHSMTTGPEGVHLGFATTAGGLAIRLTRDEAVTLRGWLVHAAGLPSIEPKPAPQVVVNLGAGRTVTAGFVRNPSTGELTPSLTPPPTLTSTPAANPDPLADLRAVLARVPELYSNLPAGDPRGVAAACNLYAAGWRADRPLAAAHRAMDWTKRQRQLAQEAFSDGLLAGMGVDEVARAA